MSVNYKLIADNDPAGELQVAFDAMRAETVTSTPETMITYRRVSAMSFAAMVALEAAIKANGDTSDAVHALLKTDGIDVNDPQVAGMLSALVPDYDDDIIALGVVTTPVYAGLKIGHLANARQMREEGKI